MRPLLILAFLLLLPGGALAGEVKLVENAAKWKFDHETAVECIDCGACVPVCPVTAIFELEELPEKWQGFADINSNYFKQ